MRHDLSEAYRDIVGRSAPESSRRESGARQNVERDGDDGGGKDPGEDGSARRELQGEARTNPAAERAAEDEFRGDRPRDKPRERVVGGGGEAEDADGEQR